MAGLVYRSCGWMLTAWMLASNFAHAAADSAKVLRIALPRAETGFDPAQANEIYSSAVIAAIMEPLLTFDYLARPVKVVPLTAEALPTIAQSGKRFTFTLKRGTYFATDPAFKGKRRELIAADYVYAIKRLVDPRNRSPNAFYVAGKIVGLDELVANAKRHGDRLDYDSPVAGLETLDRYTLRVTLTQSDYTFPQVMALPQLAAVAREVVDAYPGELAAHPVGTGAYVLKKWVPASKMILQANPGYRGFTWNFEPGDDPADKAIAARMRGRKMPQIGTIDISVMEEAQSRWLAFQKGELDLIDLPGTFAPVGLPGGKLAPPLAKQGVYLSRLLQPAINYTAFNMRDPVDRRLRQRQARTAPCDCDGVRHRGRDPDDPQRPGGGAAGGDSAGCGRLRRAAIAARRLTTSTPRTSCSTASGTARAATATARLPDGKPLVITFASQTTATAREFEELWKKAFDSIGIRMNVEKGKFSDQIRAAIACKHQMWSYGWIADYPDGDNFMQLLYGGNIGQSNVACYASPTFDALYEKSRLLPDSPDRDKLYEQMTRQFEADMPWRLGTANYQNTLVHANVIGYKAHPVLLAEWMYVDVERRK